MGQRSAGSPGIPSDTQLPSAGGASWDNVPQDRQAYRPIRNCRAPAGLHGTAFRRVARHTVRYATAERRRGFMGQRSAGSPGIPSDTQLASAAGASWDSVPQGRQAYRPIRSCRAPAGLHGTAFRRIARHTVRYATAERRRGFMGQRSAGSPAIPSDTQLPSADGPSWDSVARPPLPSPVRLLLPDRPCQLGNLSRSVDCSDRVTRYPEVGLFGINSAYNAGVDTRRPQRLTPNAD